MAEEFENTKRIFSAEGVIAHREPTGEITMMHHEQLVAMQDAATAANPITKLVTPGTVIAVDQITLPMDRNHLTELEALSEQGKNEFEAAEQHIISHFSDLRRLVLDKYEATNSGFERWPHCVSLNSFRNIHAVGMRDGDDQQVITSAIRFAGKHRDCTWISTNSGSYYLIDRVAD
jgi:hypothetical protein